MPDGQVLEFTRVTKRFNDVTAVSDLSARVEPGVVTAFLGPNGAGKTTTLRILLDQVRATSGTATIGGSAYADLRHPLRTIGAVLEETVYRPRRTAVRQLTIAAKANGIPLSRIDEVLSLVGMESESEARIGALSLGMRQRLSVAHALLGDPGALVFDEPANGLDPEGIRWMRLLMRRLADEGRTVLVSSHVLSEVEQVADNVLVLSKGQLVLASGIEKLADPSLGSVVVDAADRGALTAALSAAGFEVEVLRSGLTVRGGHTSAVGAVAASAGIALSTLVQRGPTLEHVFIELVRGGSLEPGAQAAATQLVAPLPSAEPAETAETPETTLPETPIPAEAVPGDPAAAAVLAAGTGAALAATEDGGDRAEPAEDASTEDAEDAAPDEPTHDDGADSGPVEGFPAPPPAAAANAEVPSFDEILFGGAPSPSEEPSTFPVATDVAPEEDAVTPEESGAGDADPDQPAAPEGTPEAAPEGAADGEAPEPEHGGDPSGIEIFDDLATTTVLPTTPALAETTVLPVAAEPSETEEAAPYIPVSAGTPGESEGAHGAVAGTGVIETVPDGESSSEEADESPDGHDDHHGNRGHAGN